MNVIKHILASSLMLGLFAMVGTVLVSGIEKLTADRITANHKAQRLKSLAEVIPPERYTNEILLDILKISASGLNRRRPITVYRARHNKKPVAAVFEVAAPNGYSGTIKILVGINFDGTLSGVRILSHKETPGLGDYIHQSRSDWILGFTGKSLQNPNLEGWAVKKDGGQFDQFTGATISPRAVVQATKRTLLYFEEHRDDIFAETTTADSKP